MARGTIIGITGGIATGKSTVAGMFQDLGAEFVDADEIAREVLAPGSPAVEEVMSAFGDGVFNTDGTIDRVALAEVIFSDAQARDTLNRITHPRIIESLKAKTDEFRATSSPNDVLVMEIPLLVEANLSWLVDKVVVVSAEQETQKNRLQMRGKLSDKQVYQRIASQTAMHKKSKQADWLVTTDCSLQDTMLQVRRIWDDIQASK
ncbi:MAG: dephospho-CoA kinase [Armatimonadota bacterium]|nr:dephospho-CoA kinase [Armatimonadota bacterium]